MRKWVVIDGECRFLSLEDLGRHRDWMKTSVLGDAMQFSTREEALLFCLDGERPHEVVVRVALCVDTDGLTVDREAGCR